jgi:hypothetical protein
VYSQRIDRQPAEIIGSLESSLPQKAILLYASLSQKGGVILLELIKTASAVAP